MLFAKKDIFKHAQSKPYYASLLEQHHHIFIYSSETEGEST